MNPSPAESRRARDEGLDAVKRRTAAWRALAGAALTYLAYSESEFTTDEVWHQLATQGVPPPDEPRAMGTVVTTAIRKGEIANTGMLRPTQRRTTADGGVHHATRVTVLRSLVKGEWRNEPAPWPPAPEVLEAARRLDDAVPGQIVIELPPQPREDRPAGGTWVCGTCNSLATSDVAVSFDPRYGTARCAHCGKVTAFRRVTL